MDAQHLELMTMPFGKYKGQYVFDLPIGYLEWLQNNVPLRENLEKAVSKAIDDHYQMESRRGRVVK